MDLVHATRAITTSYGSPFALNQTVEAISANLSTNGPVHVLKVFMTARQRRQLYTVVEYTVLKIHFLLISDKFLVKFCHFSLYDYEYFSVTRPISPYAFKCFTMMQYY